MRQYLAILALFTLAACSGNDDKTAGDDDDDTAPGDDDDDDAGCGNSIGTVFPANGDNDVYYKTDVRFTLTTADPGASIVVTDPGGATITGTTSVEGTLVSWTGDDLAPDTQYTATISYGTCADGVAVWTTSSTGATAASPVNKVYDLDLASGSWILPSPTIGPVLAGLIPEDFQLFVMPTAADTEITMLGALGDGANNQDVCTPSLPFPPASYDNPYFSIESDLLPISIDTFTISITDLKLSGAFSPNADRIQGASLRGTIDVRDLGALLGDTDACEAVVAFGVECAACPDGGEPYCISVWVDNIVAAEVSTSPLVLIEPADVTDNPDCDTTTP